jgi:metal-responsive CopG/Arc/MetJ family transcriptional regulator
MATVKTAISMPEHLFEELEAAAKEMQVSRSQVFALAVKKFLRERENRRILEQLNRVYGDGPDEEEREYLKRMKARYRKIIEGEW